MIIDRDPTYFDYMDSLLKVIDNYHVKNMLEFGLGLGTEMLVTKVKVTSVELQVYKEYAGWFEFIKDRLKGNKDWKGYLFNCGESYEDGMSKVVERSLKKKYDLVFVDPATENRPLIINSCIDAEVPIIVAHDTKTTYKLVPWSEANRDKKYYEEFVDTPKGTTFYFRKDIKK